VFNKPTFKGHKKMQNVFIRLFDLLSIMKKRVNGVYIKAAATTL
jgi:hypothetical protein